MSGGVTRRQYRERQRTARDRSHNRMADAQPQALGVLNRLKQSLADAWGQKDPRALPPPVGRQRWTRHTSPRLTRVGVRGNGPAEGKAVHCGLGPRRRRIRFSQKHPDSGSSSINCFLLQTHPFGLIVFTCAVGPVMDMETCAALAFSFVVFVCSGCVSGLSLHYKQWY
jgi:hypothetical protein